MVNPFFIFFDGQKATMRGFDDRIQFQRNVVTSRRMWVQCEKVVKPDNTTEYDYCDGRVEDYTGTFSERKGYIMREELGFKIQDKWAVFSHFSLLDMKKFVNCEGIVLQLDDVVEPVYRFKGTPLRTSFYAKNKYTIDLNYQAFEVNFRSIDVAWPAGREGIQEFDLKGNWIRDRADKKYCNTPSEIGAAKRALSVIEVLTVLRDAFALDDNALRDLGSLRIEDLPDDLSDDSVRSLMLSTRNDDVATKKRIRIVAKELVERKRLGYFSQRLRGFAANDSGGGRIIQKKTALDIGVSDENDLYDIIMKSDENYEF